MSPKQPQGLFSIRTAVIVLAATVIGLVGGIAHYLEYHSVVGCLGSGGGAFGATLGLLHRLVERPGRGSRDGSGDQDGPSASGAGLGELLDDGDTPA